MRKIAAVVLLGLLSAGSAFGITVDGSLADWGVTGDMTTAAADPGNSFFQTTQPGITSWVMDGVIIPGSGAQNFDAEAAYLTVANNQLYGAFVGGFDKAGQYGWNTNTWYSTGDLFFDLGSDGNWDFAIALYSHDGFIEGNAYKPTSGTDWYTVPTDFGSSVPAQLKKGSGVGFEQLSGIGYWYTPGVAGDDLALAGTYTTGDHNIVEVSVPGSYFLTSTKVIMHYTQSCGNDVFNLERDFSLHGDVLVPEPGTAILALGAALAGAFARRRMRRERARAADAA